jgi:hypothetical protein
MSLALEHDIAANRLPESAAAPAAPAARPSAAALRRPDRRRRRWPWAALAALLIGSLALALVTIGGEGGKQPAPETIELDLVDLKDPPAKPLEPTVDDELTSQESGAESEACAGWLWSLPPCRGKTP